MIKPGDHLMFADKWRAKQYGHNRPVEVVYAIPNLAYGLLVVCRVWEANLYVGQKEHLVEKGFHESCFKLAPPWNGGDDGLQVATDNRD